MASELMLTTETAMMLLLLLQGVAIGLRYASEVHRLGLEVPMTYEVYDDLYANGNYLMPAKSSSSGEGVVGPDAAGLAPRWMLEDDEVGLERFLSMVDDLETLTGLERAYWGLQMVIVVLMIWQLLEAANFHQRMNFVLATLREAFMDDLLYFFMVLGLLQTQLGAAGHILFGARFETYSRQGLEFTAVDMFVANLYYFMNASFIHLVLLNFLMVIMADAQQEVKDGFDSPHSHGPNGLLVKNPHGQFHSIGFFLEIPELFINWFRTKTVVDEVDGLSRRLRWALMKADMKMRMKPQRTTVSQENSEFKALLAAFYSCRQIALLQMRMPITQEQRALLEGKLWSEAQKQ
eukprot:gene14992-17723_t